MDLGHPLDAFPSNGSKAKDEKLKPQTHNTMKPKTLPSNNPYADPQVTAQNVTELLTFVLTECLSVNRAEWSEDNKAFVKHLEDLIAYKQKWENLNEGSAEFHDGSPTIL